MPVNKTTQSVTSQFWSKGCNSMLHPSELGQGMYHWGENIINRGGMVQTRPGFMLRASVAGDNLQGFCTFTPKNSLTRLVIAVDGIIYYGLAPNYIFVRIEGLKFDPAAPIITFQVTLQSTDLNEDGTIELIDPQPVLIIQDGTNAAGSWTGSIARQMRQDAPFNETKTGLWMAWVASRLWVARDNFVYASDEANPLSFSEEGLAERSGFSMPSFVTGMVETADQRGLLVFTDQTTTSILASIRDRTTWATTPDFQRLLLKSIGCVAGRTACNQYGLTYWLSASGVMSLDAALYSQRSAMVQSVDAEMIRCKRNLSPVLDLACATSYDNMLLFSVPSGGRYNEQTMLLDQSPIESGGSPAAWTGIWTGIRPMQWATGTLAGRRKLLCASYDKTSANDTHIHIWEAFRRDRQDSGRISCQFYTAAITSDTTIRFKFARFELAEVLGEVDLTVYMTGTRGPWYLIGEYHLSGEIGSLALNKILNLSSIIETYRPQVRTLTTEEFKPGSAEQTGEMGKFTPGVDKGFRLLFEWRGRMGVRKVTMYYANEDETIAGACTPDETIPLAINEFGEDA